MFSAPRDEPRAPVWGVAALLGAAGDALAARFAGVVVEGEIAGFTRAASGHCYFSLKDADGAPGLIRCAMFRRAALALLEPPQDGWRVQVRGRLALYEPRGELQLVVEGLRRAGEGALYEQFLRLKARLEAEGLFEPARKRPLPTYPRVLGVITSPAGAALHDVLTALARRAPHVRVILYPSVVQGAAAPAALVAALEQANREGAADALLLCRGGGSLEDLWAFNDERLVRAVAHSALPVVCGVGHETDVTLADMAADVRAPTPTAAAELAAPSRDVLLRQIDQLGARAGRALQWRLDHAAQRLDHLALRLGRPHALLAQAAHRLALLSARWQAAAPQPLRRASEHLARLEARLDGLDPRRVLERGYAWLQDPVTATPLTGIGQLAVDQEVQALLHDGEARLKVQSASPSARARKRRRPT